MSARAAFFQPPDGLPHPGPGHQESRRRRPRGLVGDRPATGEHPPPATLRSPHSRRASVTNRAAPAASTAEARTTRPAVRNTVGKVVDETRIAPRPDPAARAT